MENRIYMDHAASTPLSAEALAAMLPFWTDHPGNASAVYGTGREARKAVERARKQVAAAIGARPEEIYFTSGGSESDNLALKGTAFALEGQGRHIITTAVEHPAVLRTCRWLEKRGYRVSYLQPDREGLIHPEQVREAICPETILISVMTANNEIGTLEPVSEIGEIAREKGILFHTDAVQAIGSVPVNVEDYRADLLSLSAHKFYGPKGVGALYVRRGTRLDPLIHGGEQERALRAGTENVPGIVGLGAAAEQAAAGLSENAEQMRKTRDRLEQGLLERIPGVSINGGRIHRLPGNLSATFPGIDGEALLLRLDLAGIAASAGSACTSGSREISHVLRAIGLSEQEARGTLRFTTGIHTTEAEIDETMVTLENLVTELRALFPGK